MQSEKIEKTPLQMEVGKKYKIQTKNGVVEKYLSYIETRAEAYYFVAKEKDINSSKTGWMFGKRGTAHNLENVIGYAE